MQTVFPSLRGESLSSQKMELPADLEGDVNLVFVAFLRHHQRDVDQWLEHLGDVEEAHPGLKVYEVPLMRRFPVFYRRWIDAGMRSGIPDPFTRSRTITVYTDRDAFLTGVGLESVDEILALLLHSDGTVLWSHEGPATDEGLGELHTAIEAVLS